MRTPALMMNAACADDPNTLTMDELDRLFRHVVQNLRGTSPEQLTGEFEVSRLYQQIVPYRIHRRELAFDSNEEYELALMQLLAGLRGYMIGDGDLQLAMRAELTSPNPDLTAYRLFASSKVRLAPDALRALDRQRFGRAGTRADAPTPLSPGEQATLAARATQAVDTDPAMATAAAPVRASALDLSGARPSSPVAPAAPVRAASSAASAGMTTPRAPSPRILTPRMSVTVESSPTRHDAPSPPPPRDTHMAVPRSTPATVAAGATCRYCSSSLPDGRRVTFCPSCGHNLTVQHCPACSTELEVEWKFCITCGRGVVELEVRVE